MSRILRTARDVRRAMASRPMDVRVNKPLPDGHVDYVMIHLDGTIAACGWSKNLGSFRNALSLTVAGARLSPRHGYRVRRPDLVTAFGQQGIFFGSVVEWIMGPSATDAPAVLYAGDDALASFVMPAVVEPAYAHLRTERRVLRREDIYGFGPPVPYVSAEVLELARTLPAPVLDFGCGAGALVRSLRNAGVEAYGLELNDGRIRDHLLEEVRPWVTLYDGRLPSPFKARQFASLCCSEVLEHIPDPAAVVEEFRRLAPTRVLITVPDMSAIPRGYNHGVVPWHLLESTHVNFFTQHSLETLLAALGSRIEVARLGQVTCDRMSYYSSLAAMVECR